MSQSSSYGVVTLNLSFLGDGVRDRSAEMVVARNTRHGSPRATVNAKIVRPY